MQGVLRGNLDALGAAGFTLPDHKGQELFLAVLHLTDRSQTWGRSDDEGRRAWEKILAGVRRHSGTTIISSETLCLASDQQIARILHDLGRAGVEVTEVIVSVRDLARQVPAEYQEGVKHGRTMSYKAFLRTVLGEKEPRQQGRVATRQRFWNAQDPVRVLDLWAAHVGPQRVHLVTTPAPGAPPEELWRRFAVALGAESVPVTMPEAEVNTSLGAVQIEVLRQVNRRIGRKGNETAYGEVVKRLYAGTILRGQRGEKLRLPQRYESRVNQIADGMIAALSERDYPVAGDLADLRPPPEAAAPAAKIPAPAVLTASLDATAELLLEVERLRVENRGLRNGNVKSRGKRRSPLKVLTGAGS